MASATAYIDGVNSVIILMHRSNPPTVYNQTKSMNILGSLTDATTKSPVSGTSKGEGA